MQRSVIRFFLFALLGGLSFAAAAAEAMTGDHLVRQLWGSLQSGSYDAVERMMAPGFQVVDPRGVRNRDQEVQHLRGMKISEYSLSDVVATEAAGPTTVVTYRISVKGTLDGKPLVVRSAPRLSVFVKNGDTWQWAAHANMTGAR